MFISPPPLLARVFFFLGRKMWKMESSFLLFSTLPFFSRPRSRFFFLFCFLSAFVDCRRPCQPRRLSLIRRLPLSSPLVTSPEPRRIFPNISPRASPPPDKQKQRKNHKCFLLPAYRREKREAEAKERQEKEKKKDTRLSPAAAEEMGFTARLPGSNTEEKATTCFCKHRLSRGSKRGCTARNSVKPCSCEEWGSGETAALSILREKCRVVSEKKVAANSDNQK